MIFKKILSLAASIIKFFIIFLLVSKTLAEENSIKKYYNDNGVLGLMYHRFDENKYPSTNIRMEIFKKQMNIIKQSGFKFIKPDEFSSNFNLAKEDKKILLTIDDAFTSFYLNAWPYLKKNKIPFILFVSTEPVGKNGYMNWDQIREIEKEDFVFIGNHSHSHEYLVDVDFNIFENDISASIKKFEEEIGYNPIYFSYPFGEYSLRQKKFIKERFKFAFGQQSGVIDVNKDKFELPRFPINEKYGDLDRFKFLVDLKPLEYNSLSLKDMYILRENNPPELIISFFKNQNNLQNINCFSNEGGKWNNSNILFKKNKVKITFLEKFEERRGRVNCSLKDGNSWRWLGLQFSIENS